MNADSWRTFLQLASYCVAIVGVIVAVFTYRANARRERAKWAVQLFEKFYESDQYKHVRDLLDSEDDKPADDLVKGQAAEFTDYLNFFELVAYMTAIGQIDSSDVLALFHYYLRSLKRHRSVMRYLNNPETGFERLSKLLNNADL